MRHRKLGRQFGRNTSHRRAMFRALTANLVLHERIETTDAKAKELRRIAERLISKARRLGPIAYTPWEELNASDRSRRLAAKRNIGQFLQRFGVISTQEESEKVDLIEKVLCDLAKRYASRPGGYTRIIRMGRRRGDAAPMCLIELVEAELEPKRQDAASDDAASADADESVPADAPKGPEGADAAGAAEAAAAPADK